MVLEHRRRAWLGRATGALSVAMGADLFAILIFSQNALLGLEGLVNGRVPNSVFLLLDLAGGVFGVIAGVSLLKFRHFNTVSFSLGCAIAVFFGITLALVHSAQLTNVLFLGTNALIVGAILLSGAVMFLSVYPWKSRY